MGKIRLFQNEHIILGGIIVIAQTVPLLEFLNLDAVHLCNVVH